MVEWLNGGMVEWLNGGIAMKLENDLQLTGMMKTGMMKTFTCAQGHARIMTH